MFEVRLEAVEAACPEMLVEVEPGLRGLERLWAEGDDAAGSAAFALYERGALEDVEVFGDGSERDGVGSGKFSHGFSVMESDVVQESTACLISKGVEDGVEFDLVFFNHMVEYALLGYICQPFG